MIANVPIGNYLIAYGVEGLLIVLRDDIASRLAFNEQSLFLNGDTESTLADNINGAYASLQTYPVSQQPVEARRTITFYSLTGYERLLKMQHLERKFQFLEPSL